MKKDVFTIEFTSFTSNHTKNIKVCKYQAAITILSKGFKLFHVGKIKRITKDGTIGLSGSYCLTSYPFSNSQGVRWKDAVTRDSNSFLQVIGDTIDQHLYESHNKFSYLTPVA